jgi:hypothetical protein
MILASFRAIRWAPLSSWVPDAFRWAAVSCVLAACPGPESGRLSAQSAPATTRPNVSDPAAVAWVERALEASGGRDRLLKIRHIRREGKVRADGLEGFYAEWNAIPGRKRVELAYPFAHWVTVVDGGRVERLAGPNRKTLEGAERADWLRRTDPWHALRGESGVLYTLGPARVIEGKQAQGVYEFFADGACALEYYDTKSGRCVRREEPAVPEQDTTFQIITSFYDYADIDGVWFARRVKREFGKRATEFVFQTIELDGTADDSAMASLEPRAPFVMSTLPKTLHREPRGSESPEDRLQFVLATPAFLPADDTELTIRLLRDGSPIETRTWRGPALFVRAMDVAGAVQIPVCLDTPSNGGYDEVECSLARGRGADIAKLKKSVDRYRLKTELVLPLRMPARVTVAHEPFDHHAGERSQAFAYDFAGCDFDGAVFMKNDAGELLKGAANEDYCGFEMEVIAPAGGEVVYARDDIEENPRPGAEARSDLYQRDPAAIGGNSVVIDHGNGEFSFLGHLHAGSVRVKAGDTVATGDVIGLVGNSGRSTAPHLHYHLMDGPRPFEADGLPARFVGVVDFQTGRRMPYLIAGFTVRPMGATASRPASRPVRIDAEREPASQPDAKQQAK